MAPMRIGGLASGMDIDQLVNDLMKAERIPLDKLYQKKQIFEWQRDAYREINKKLADFDQYLFDNFMLSSNFYKKTATSSNEAAVSVKALSSSYDSTNTITVSQLAMAATGVSGEVGNASSATKLSEKGLAAETKITIVALQANGTYKEEEITFSPDDTIADVVKKLNQSSLNINAIFDDSSKKLGISTRATGTLDTIDVDKAEVYVKSATGDDIFATIFGFGTGNDQNGNSGVTSLANGGQNAKFTLNGLEMERQSNTFTINGIEYTVKAVTSTPVTVTSSTDVDGMIAKIEEFVNKYNELIGALNDKIREKRYRDYPPLTDEQKKEMTEKQIELWEEKAKSGLLRGDSIISNGLSQMRRDLYSRVDGIGENVIDTLSEFGITTTSEISSGGKLVIDYDKLRKALESDPDKVVKTLTQNGAITKDSATGQVTSDTRGIVQRLRDTIKGIITNIEKKAGKPTYTENQYSIGLQLRDVENQISDFQRRLQDIESRYWRQFTAMEQAIQRANQQSMFLMGQFGGGM
ncbi:flagellar hook-associated protein 2 [Parageobacillus thermoglucosidasius]|uniref:Flagellar hook-associated protein 2 n=1 Tax=Parageobacillus thermoglucosidasius TaxID=1426 RepID=A0AB38QY58_PARTM|nr:flagellar hook-associated protein 2 [Parageobacillus thermoglucosidasius]UOE76050.1 flagellar hook-associated protein 2 [Parageobacillus thermoglucosidasius]GCD81167.1 flagellar hook-associated protein 2 [Parageobacillus thermoglucosidasius]